jgi:phytoene dehydrogenase-like protein
MTSQPRELIRLARVGWDTRRRGRQTMLDLLRILPMSIAELLDQWFVNDALRAALAAAGVMHLHQGPQAGGTALVLLQQHMGCPPGVFRPPVSRLRAALLASAAGRFEIRYDARVDHISIRDGRAQGVVLVNGEEIVAGVVACSLDTRTTLLRLVGPDALDPDTIQAARAIRSRGVSAVVSLELEQPADFKSLFVADSLDHLERAHDDAKYGRVSSHPWIEASVDPLQRNTRVHVHAQYAPYAPAGRAWSDLMREEFGQRVVDRLRVAAPGLPGVLRQTVRVPPDLERDFGWPAGQPHHAEPALDQWLFMRPLPGYGYRAPVPNLYLCGPGAHPGLFPLGAAGANAAAAILGRSE